MEKKKEKMYPFSVLKHGHDIELYHNYLFNTKCDMECGIIPMNEKRYEAICEMYYGELFESVYDAMFNSRDGRITYLTGKQIGLAKKIVAWAYEYRAGTLIRNGKMDYLQYL